MIRLLGYEMSSIALGLGSNIGDSISLCRRAVKELEKIAEIQILRNSAWYETRPVGFANQPNFINGAILLETDLPPLELLYVLKGIEEDFGRSNTRQNGPREIDLDLLLYDNIVLNLPNLTIPHPAMADRAFVLVPLVEIHPMLIHPVSGRTVSDLLEDLGQVEHLVNYKSEP